MFSCTTKSSFSCNFCEYKTNKKKSSFDNHLRSVHKKPLSKHTQKNLNKLKGELDIEEKVFDENYILNVSSLKSMVLPYVIT